LSFFKVVIDSGAPEIGDVTLSSAVLLSIGIVLLVVLLLNLLIALFSKTFDKIAENAIQEYVLEMASLTFEWTRAPRLPPPFNFALAFKEMMMNVIAKYVWLQEHHRTQKEQFLKNQANWHPEFSTLPKFNKATFLSMIKREENANGNEPRFDQDGGYNAWRCEVLRDWAAEDSRNDITQMDGF
jgi:hypothetical protein